MSAYAEGRFELKYAIPASCRDRIVDIVRDYAVPDANGVDIGGGAIGYHVFSLYFDRPDCHDYFERLESLRIRNRLRIRTYGSPGQKQPVFLENKRKYEDRVVKHRVKVADADSWAASTHPTPWGHFGESCKGRGRFSVDDFSMRVEAGREPMTVVSYRREVFVDPKPEVRIRLTVDHDVGACRSHDLRNLHAPPTHHLIPPDWVVLEFKFDGDKPLWMRKIAKEFRLRAEPISKFGLSMVHCVRGRRYRELRWLTPHSVRKAGLLESAA